MRCLRRRDRSRRVLLATLLAAAAVVPMHLPARAEPGERRGAETVTRYLEVGGEVPPWARAAGLRAALLEAARRHGLAMVADLPAGDSPRPEEMLAATLRLAQMLARGAVAPSSVQRDWTIPRPSVRLDAMLRELVALDDPLPWLRQLAPQAQEYGRLEEAMQSYAAVRGRGGSPAAPGPAVLKPGTAGERVAALQSRLKVANRLASDLTVSAFYDAETEKTVRAFQSSHGLAADGQAGPATLAALDIELENRYRRIAANMERWRWLPHELPGERAMVNAAAAQLVLFEAGRPTLELRTIVGKPRQPTPALAATITSLLFNPPWDIPLRIAAQEIQPLAEGDPGYLERQGIIATRGGERLRQRPGPMNALGRVKFEMPNTLDVYLHDTPNKELFRRPRRFFSHGCVRVENPEAMAQRLLRHESGWTAAAIDDAMAAETTRRVMIDPPLPVFVVYFTAVARPDGMVELLDDVYHRDRPLMDALFPASTS